jgi:nitroreductase
MDTLDAIRGRRSIRRFRDTPVPRELVERVLDAAVQAPSAKNRQPWRFVVLEGAACGRLARLMTEAVDPGKAGAGDTGSAAVSARIVARAPVTIVVFNASHEHEGLIFDHVRYNAPDMQSLGGMIQTMLLAAHDQGLGSLWICDVLYAYTPIREWLGRRQELVAAVSLGYADEAPAARPRTPWGELTEWKRE